MRALWVAPLAHAWLACGAQVEPDYPGEPLATLHGVIETRAALSDGLDVSAAIVWFAPDEDDPGQPRYIGERVDIEGDFPASFVLRLYGPPPPEAELRLPHGFCATESVSRVVGEGESCPGLLVPPGTRMGEWGGYLAAIDSSVSDGEIELSDIKGIDTEHIIVYFDDDDARKGPLPAHPTVHQYARFNRLISTGYDQSLDAGYHLARHDPDRREPWSAALDCKWEGLCVRWTEESEVSQHRADWSFERCTDRFPGNPTCDAFVDPPRTASPRRARSAASATTTSPSANASG